MCRHVRKINLHLELVLLLTSCVVFVDEKFQVLGCTHRGEGHSPKLGSPAALARAHRKAVRLHLHLGGSEECQQHNRHMHARKQDNKSQHRTRQAQESQRQTSRRSPGDLARAVGIRRILCSHCSVWRSRDGGMPVVASLLDSRHLPNSDCPCGSRRAHQTRETCPPQNEAPFLERRCRENAQCKTRAA
jgi:hypothetical protein